MKVLYFHVFTFSASLVGALRIRPVGLNVVFNEQEAWLDPENLKCTYLPSDIPEKLKDWEYLFSIGSGKKILLQGDSLMKQVYKVIRCAADALGMYTKQAGSEHGSERNEKTVMFIKRSEHADMGLEVHSHEFYDFQGVDKNEMRWDHKRSRTVPIGKLCDNIGKYDYVFSNLGHHEIRPDSGASENNFKDKVHTIFEQAKACGWANSSHFSWVGHPPSHFKDSMHHGGSYTSECSCDVSNLEQQPNIRNSQYAKQVAGNYGFKYISVWDDFKDQCDQHPVDCVHYTVSPTVFAPIIRKITAAIQSS